MKKEKLKQLKEILSIPTYFGMENLVVDYLVKHGQDKGYVVEIDKRGNEIGRAHV